MTHPVVEITKYQELLAESVIGMLANYYESGVISRVDYERYGTCFAELHHLYNEKLMAIFGCCQARLETLKGIK